MWDAIRDVGAVHERLAPGFVADIKMDGDARVVTFGNGLVARELIVDRDDEPRRLAWGVVGGRMHPTTPPSRCLPTAHGGSRVVWIADLLPNDLAGDIAGMIDQGMAAMKRTLEQAAHADLALSLPAPLDSFRGWKARAARSRLRGSAHSVRRP